MNFSSIKRRCMMYFVNHVFAGTKYFGIKRWLLKRIGYTIGSNTKIVGPVFNTGRLIVGANCWVGRNLTIHGNGVVMIGDNCDVAPDVTFLTGGHRIGGHDRRAGLGERYQITIGSGVWLGARSTCCGEISVGDGSVVAACACVVGDVPEDVLVGGVPAGVIRELPHA